MLPRLIRNRENSFTADGVPLEHFMFYIVCDCSEKCNCGVARNFDEFISELNVWLYRKEFAIDLNNYMIYDRDETPIGHFSINPHLESANGNLIYFIEGQNPIKMVPYGFHSSRIQEFCDLFDMDLTF